MFFFGDRQHQDPQLFAKGLKKSFNLVTTGKEINPRQIGIIIVLGHRGFFFLRHPAPNPFESGVIKESLPYAVGLFRTGRFGLVWACSNVLIDVLPK